MRIIAIAIMWLLAASAAQARDFYNFNGSVVEVTTDGQQMTINYVTPARGLNPAIGPGTLIFEGGVNEDSKELEGYAYVFDECGRQKFKVTGSEASGGRILELVGLIGLRKKRQCNAGGFIDRTTLQFIRR